MKSDFVGIGEADLISSEAKAEDFIRACEDFIVQRTISLKIQGLRLDLFAIVWYNVAKKGGGCFAINKYLDNVCDNDNFNSY